MSARDGGPAFPSGIPWEHSVERGKDLPNFTESGMTLRDYFAGQALAGICGDGIPGSHHQPVRTAQEAYLYADEMLKAREQA